MPELIPEPMPESMPAGAMSGARVLLVGQGITTASALAGLIDEFDVVGLLRTAPSDDAAVVVATERGIPIESDASIAAVARTIDAVRPDIVVVSSYDRILPADLVDKVPFVNVHYAPLPRYRGRATVNWAIINGDSHAAISIHSLAPGLDAGGILFQQAVEIGPRDTVGDLYVRLNEVQRVALAPAVARRLAGDEGAPQDESQATYACTRTPDDGEIDWTASTQAVDRLVRALADPFPGAFTWLGTQRIGIRKALPVDDAPVYSGRVPGRVVAVDRRAGTVDVLTGDGVLRLVEVTVDGGPTGAASVVTSVRQTLGLRLSAVLDLLRNLDRR